MANQRAVKVAQQVWERLDQGAEPHDLTEITSLRTVERLRSAREKLLKGIPRGEIDPGWTPRYAKQIEEQLDEYLKHHPGDQKADGCNNVSAPLLKGAFIQLVDRLVEKMWVPEPDDVPIYFIEGGPGFRTAEVRGSHFCWSQGDVEQDRWDGRSWVTKNVLRVMKVWFTSAEEAQLEEVLKSVDDAQGSGLRQRYRDLQQETVDYVRRAISYQSGVDTSGWPSISTLWSMELAGQKIKLEDPDVAASHALMKNVPMHRGLVEEFRRDLQLAVLRQVETPSR